MQTIRLRYWAAARSAAGTSEDHIEVTGPSTLADLLEAAVQRHPDGRFSDVLSVCSVLVGDEPVATREPKAVRVDPGATVEFLPPFAGG